MLVTTWVEVREEVTVLGKLDRYMPEKETRPHLYTIYKNKLKMD